LQCFALAVGAAREPLPAALLASYTSPSSSPRA
jgi:hypothetical protein